MKVPPDTNAYSALKPGTDLVVRHVTRTETVYLSSVHVSRNSSVQLGEENPAHFTQQPNLTTVNNRRFGIRCGEGGHVSANLGAITPLNGEVSQFGGGAANNFAGSCTAN